MSDSVGSGGEAKKSDVHMKFEKLSNGNYKVSGAMEGNADENSLIPPEELEKMLGDSALTVRVFGKVVSGNGSIAGNKKSIEWKMLLADAAKGKDTIIEAEVGPRTQLPDWVWPAIPVAVFVLLFLLTRKKKGA